MSAAYVYRKANLDEIGLRQLLADVFDNGGVWAFGMHSAYIEPITETTPSKVKLADSNGAFTDGHVFNERAEVRWKRRNNAYDALVLTEQLIPVLQNHVFVMDVGSLRSRVVSQKKTSVAIVLATPREEVQNQIQWRLEYIEYVAPNGAVQFVRHTILRKEHKV